MKIARFQDLYQALAAMLRLQRARPEEDTLVYYNERLLFASYERGQTQLERLQDGERRVLARLIHAQASA